MRRRGKRRNFRQWAARARDPFDGEREREKERKRERERETGREEGKGEDDNMLQKKENSAVYYVNIRNLFAEKA